MIDADFTNPNKHNEKITLNTSVPYFDNKTLEVIISGHIFNSFDVI